ncbi:MAG TPA: hypothetical protein VFB34_01005 [Chloroflexota bacterium]|nr:hypothetical protein [Chloroflexota bacterium]
MPEVGIQAQSQDESQGKDETRPPARVPGSVESHAWQAYNQAFHSPDADTYRRVGRELYKQALEDRIQDLFSRSDDQNSVIEAHLKS